MSCQNQRKGKDELWHKLADEELGVEPQSRVACERYSACKQHVWKHSNKRNALGSSPHGGLVHREQEQTPPNPPETLQTNYRFFSLRSEPACSRAACCGQRGSHFRPPKNDDVPTANVFWTCGKLPGRRAIKQTMPAGHWLSKPCLCERLLPKAT